MEFKRNAQFKFNRPRLEQWKITSLEDRYILWPTILWLSGIIISLLSIALFYSRIPDQVPLFYSQLWGEAQLGNRNYLFLLPAGLFVFGTIDLLITQISYRKYRAISYLLVSSVAVITVLATLSILNIIHILT